MKTRCLLTLGALLTIRGALAADATAPCCVVPPPTAKPACCCEEQKPAAPLSTRSIYQLDATWTNDAGRTQPLAALRGRPVVLAMFFASCEYACPVLVNDIKRLRAALPEAERDRAQLVLVTFDTVRDTPAALKAFRARMELGENWTLLRSDAGAVQELAMLLGVKYKQDARGQFAHSNLLTILNSEGEIVHQHAGLNGDISDTAKVLAAAK